MVGEIQHQQGYLFVNRPEADNTASIRLPSTIQGIFDRLGIGFGRRYCCCVKTIGIAPGALNTI